MSTINNDFNSKNVNQDVDFDEINSIMNDPIIKKCMEFASNHPIGTQKIFKDLKDCCRSYSGTTEPIDLILHIKDPLFKKIVVPIEYKPVLDKEFGSENVFIGLKPRDKPEGKAKFRFAEEVSSDIENNDLIIINIDGTVERYQKDEFSVVPWSPEQLIAINQASQRAFNEIENLYKKQQEKLKKQDKNNEEPPLSDWKISNSKYDGSSQKKEVPSYQKYLKARDNTKERVAQELIATEQTNQQRRKRKKVEKEKDAKYSELQKDIQDEEQKKYEQKIIDIKNERSQ